MVVAAHPDDEVLGVGGTLLKHKAAGDKISVLILANGEDSRDNGADAKKRLEKAKEAARRFGAELFFKNFPDNAFDSVPLLKIAKAVEKIVGTVKPAVVYTHHFGDLNVDHRIAFQAVLTACRPQPGFPVKKILAFETLSSTEWQSKNESDIFKPTFYNNISNFLEEKIKILKIYKNEIREFPHPRSLEGVRTLAAFRGMEAGMKAAEAFEVIRIIK